MNNPNNELPRLHGTVAARLRPHAVSGTMRSLPQDWFRTDAWDDEAKVEFERRLGRASVTKRPQYLRIKGLALAAANQHDAARALWLRVLREYPTDLDVSAATEHLADMERRLGAKETSERYYRQLLQQSPTLNATSGMAEVSLAELLIDRGDERSRSEALTLLDSALHRRQLLPDELFRWHVALARAALDMGDVETQQRAARTALRLAEKATGPFPRHPTVGVVQADEGAIGWLEEVAAGSDTRHPPTARRRWLRKS